MRFKTVSAITVGITLFAAFALGGASFGAAAKPGAACTKAGAVNKSTGYPLVCVKSGKKLVWKLQTKPAVTPSPTASPSASPSELQPSPSPTVEPAVNKCKLPVADGRGDVAIAFPRIKDRMRDIGDVRVKVVFVDFSDAPATISTAEALKLVEKSSDIFKSMSYGKMNYIIDPTPKWYRMSLPSTGYYFNTYESQHSYVEEALAVADPTVDFSTSDSFLIFANPDAKHFNNGPAASYQLADAIKVDGKYLNNGATSGNDIYVWKSMWLNHEISHSMGLVDLYARDDAGLRDGYHRYVGQFSYMGFSSLDSQAPSLFAWERWVLGWIDDSQVTCTTQPGTYQLTALNAVGGNKVVVIPTGETTAIAVEYRTALGYDSKIAKEGALVYNLDTSAQSGFGPLLVQSNFNNQDDLWKLKAPLAVGESITDGKFTITMSAASDGVATITVK